MKKKNNILGYITGIILGFVFSIPWLLCYSVFNLSVAYFSFLIVIGIILGYKLINKKIYNNKNTKIYLVLSSVLIIMLNIWLFMPLIIINKYDKNIPFISIYSYDSLMKGLIIDSIIAAIMVVIPSLLLPIDFKRNANKKSESKEFLEKVEKVFEKHNAFSKENAYDKRVIKEELNKIDISPLKRLFYIDIIKGFKIKSSKGKRYYKKTKKDFKIGALLVICILIIFTGLCNIILSLISINGTLNIDKNNYKINTLEKSGLRKFNINDKLVLQMPDCMKYYKDEYNENQKRYYYQYISRNVDKSDIEVVELYYYESFDNNNINEKFYENIKKSLEKYGIKNEEVKTINDKNINYYKLENLDETRYVNAYYIPFDNKIVEAYIYINKNKYDEKDDNTSDEIIKSLKLYNEE